MVAYKNFLNIKLDEGRKNAHPVKCYKMALYWRKKITKVFNLRLSPKYIRLKSVKKNFFSNKVIKSVEP